MSLQDLNCFFIVGAPRCGTSALSSYLRKHPSVCFSLPKETNFFFNAKNGVSPAILKSQFMKAFFAPVEDQTQILGDGSVSTLYSAQTLLRVQESFPDAKFIVMLREPVSLMRSYHARMVYINQETEQDFETAWNLQEARAKGRSIPKSCYDPRMLQYWKVGSLGRYTAQLFDLVGRENCLAVLFDDFTRDTLTTYRETLEFLDLPDDGRTKFQRKNLHSGYKNAFLQGIYSGTALGPLGRKMATQPRHLARLARMTRSIRKKIRNRNRVFLEVQPFDADLAGRLREFFREDIEQLSHLLQRDLGHWLSPPDVGRSVRPVSPSA